jgi:hypothetical protein
VNPGFVIMMLLISAFADEGDSCGLAIIRTDH